MDYTLLYERLIPGAEYYGVPGEAGFTWTDSRPEPTEQELTDEWVVYLEEVAIKENNEAAYIEYTGLLDAGYEHTDGFVYYCTEAATTDMMKVLTLFDLDPKEPVTIITLDGTIRDLTWLEFRKLTKEIGNYQYTLRKTYWSQLQR